MTKYNHTDDNIALWFCVASGFAPTERNEIKLMKNIGKFTIDDFGRILIPRKLRTMLNWDIGSRINMFYADGNTAVLQLEKEDEHMMCAICEEAAGSILVKCATICQDCVNDVVKRETL